MTATAPSAIEFWPAPLDGEEVGAAPPALALDAADSEAAEAEAELEGAEVLEADSSADSAPDDEPDAAAETEDPAAEVALDARDDKPPALPLEGEASTACWHKPATSTQHAIVVYHSAVSSENKMAGPGLTVGSLLIGRSEA